MERKLNINSWPLLFLDGRSGYLFICCPGSDVLFSPTFRRIFFSCCSTGFLISFPRTDDCDGIGFSSNRWDSGWWWWWWVWPPSLTSPPARLGWWFNWNVLSLLFQSRTHRHITVNSCTTKPSLCAQPRWLVSHRDQRAREMSLKSVWSLCVAGRIDATANAALP